MRGKEEVEEINELRIECEAAILTLIVLKVSGVVAMSWRVVLTPFFIGLFIAILKVIYLIWINRKG